MTLELAAASPGRDTRPGLRRAAFMVVAATPLGAAFGGVLLQYLSAPLVIVFSALACIIAGLGGLISPSLRRLQRGNP